MDEFEQSLPMLLNRTLDAVMPPYREIFTRFDLTEPQWRVLRVVWSGEKIKSVDLSSRTLLAPASIVGIIDRLERKGLVSRVRSTTDRRAVYITATAKSRQLHAEAGPQVTDIQSRVRQLVTQKEWTQMESTLHKISAALHSDQSAVLINQKVGD